MSNPTNIKYSNGAIIYAVKKLVELYPDGFGSESIAVVVQKLLSKTKEYTITQLTNAVNYLAENQMIGKGFGIVDSSQLVSQTRVSVVMPDGRTRNVTVRKSNQISGRVVQGRIDEYGNFIASDNGEYYIQPMSNSSQMGYIPLLANADTISRKGKLVGAKLFYDANGDNPIAKVDKTFEGKEYTTPLHSHQMAIAYDLGVCTQPSDAIMDDLLREYNGLPNTITPEIIDKMKAEYGDWFKDKTDRPFVTIDPDDCDEEDDAVLASIITADDEKHPELAGGIKEEVAISNVGQFLLWLGKDSRTFKYYTENGTNTYMLDLVFTILLPQFNKGMGSLKPHEKRLAVYTTIWRDAKGNMVDYEINPAVIEVKEKFSYKQADALRYPSKEELAKLPKDQQAKLLMEIGERRSKYSKEVLDNLDTLDILDEKVRELRLQKGTTAFDSDERNYRISTDGKRITGVTDDNGTKAHRDIETPALSANKVMAMEAAKLKLPFIYRVEEEITAENRAKIIEVFTANNLKFGATIFSSDTEFKIAMNKALEECRTTNRFNKLSELQGLKPEVMEEEINERRELLAKTMSMRGIRFSPQAHYSANNIGHSSLNFEYYSHTTSPDRRAVDGVNQMQYLYYKRTGEILFTQEELQEMCEVFNDKERAAKLCDRRCQAYGDVMKVNEMLVQKTKLFVNACICDVNSSGVTVLTKLGEVTMPFALQSGSKPNAQIKVAPNGLSVTNCSTCTAYVVGTPCKVNITGVNPDAEMITGDVIIDKQPYAELGGE